MKRYINFAHREHRGVTLLELLICIAITSISIMLVSTSIPNFLNRARLTASVNEMRSALQLARVSAIAHETTVTLCPVADGKTCSKHEWHNHWLVFEDVNNNLILDRDEVIFRYFEKPHATVLVKGTRSKIRFIRGGINATPASLYFCLPSQKSPLSRGFVINLQGRVKRSQDKNNDGIHEKTSGAPIDCL